MRLWWWWWWLLLLLLLSESPQSAYPRSWTLLRPSLPQASSQGCLPEQSQSYKIDNNNNDNDNEDNHCNGCGRASKDLPLGSIVAVEGQIQDVHLQEPLQFLPFVLEVVLDSHVVKFEGYHQRKGSLGCSPWSIIIIVTI